MGWNTTRGEQQTEEKAQRRELILAMRARQAQSLQWRSQVTGAFRPCLCGAEKGNRYSRGNWDTGSSPHRMTKTRFSQALQLRRLREEAEAKGGLQGCGFKGPPSPAHLSRSPHSGLRFLLPIPAPLSPACGGLGGALGLSQVPGELEHLSCLFTVWGH